MVSHSTLRSSFALVGEHVQSTLRGTKHWNSALFCTCIYSSSCRNPTAGEKWRHSDFTIWSKLKALLLLWYCLHQNFCYLI